MTYTRTPIQTRVTTTFRAMATLPVRLLGLRPAAMRKSWTAMSMSVATMSTMATGDHTNPQNILLAGEVGFMTLETEVSAAHEVRMEMSNTLKMRKERFFLSYAFFS